MGDFVDACAYIASPFYPEKYPYDKSDCVWSFVTRDPENVFKVDLVDWHKVKKIPIYLRDF